MENVQIIATILLVIIIGAIVFVFIQYLFFTIRRRQEQKEKENLAKIAPPKPYVLQEAVKQRPTAEKPVITPPPIPTVIEQATMTQPVSAKPSRRPATSEVVAVLPLTEDSPTAEPTPPNKSMQPVTVSFPKAEPVKVAPPAATSVVRPVAEPETQAVPVETPTQERKATPGQAEIRTTAVKETDTPLPPSITPTPGDGLVMPPKDAQNLAALDALIQQAEPVLRAVPAPDLEPERLTRKSRSVLPIVNIELMALKRADATMKALTEEAPKPKASVAPPQLKAPAPVEAPKPAPKPVVVKQDVPEWL